MNAYFYLNFKNNKWSFIYNLNIPHALKMNHGSNFGLG